MEEQSTNTTNNENKFKLDEKCGQTFSSLEETLNPGEIAKEIIDHPGYYITDQGKVISKKSNNKYYVMSPSKKNDKYLRVGIIDKNGQRVEWQIHRLVAIHFIPIPESLQQYKTDFLQVNHINNPYDNNAKNLEWMTPKGNNIFAGEDTENRWDQNSVSIFSNQGNYLFSFPSLRKAFDALNITNPNIRAMIPEIINTEQLVMDMYWRKYNSIKHKEGYNLFDEDEKRENPDLEKFRFDTECRPIFQLDLFTNKIINRYNSIMEASVFINKATHINNSLFALVTITEHPMVTMYGSRWILESDYYKYISNK